MDRLAPPRAAAIVQAMAWGKIDMENLAKRDRTPRAMAFGSSSLPNERDRHEDTAHGVRSGEV
jgi:hypothetical protein